MQRRCVCPAGTLPFRSRSDRRGSRLPGKGPYRAPWSKELRLAPVVMTQIRPDHQAPITLYQRIIVAQAGSVVVHTALAEYLIAIGQKDRARAEVGQAASLAPHDPNIFRQVAKLHASLGLWPQAKESIHKATTRNPRDVARDTGGNHTPPSGRLYVRCFGTGARCF